MMFIALVLVVGALLARLYPGLMSAAARPCCPGRAVAAYAMGGIAAVWFVERVIAF
jgi:hypothetical protein